MQKAILILNEMPFETPLGTLLLLADQTGILRGVEWAENAAILQRLLTRHYGKNGFYRQQKAVSKKIIHALRAYFSGALNALDSLPVRTAGTAFQHSVWSTLRTIPAGKTSTYQEMASLIGHPNAARAVGSANASNPISLVIPCHRVIGTSGNLTGYAGGLKRKHWLLMHEGALHTAP